MIVTLLQHCERWYDCMDINSCMQGLDFFERKMDELAGDIVDAEVEDSVFGDDLYWYKQALRKDIRRMYRVSKKLESRLSESQRLRRAH